MRALARRASSTTHRPPSARARRRRVATRASVIDVPDLVVTLRAIATAGCDIIRDVTARGDLRTRDKGGDVTASGAYVADAQTEADRRVEAMAVATMMKYHPNARVVAEESFERACETDASAALELTATMRRASEEERNGWARELRRGVEASRVAVYHDPLDGTNEYAAGERRAITVLFGVAVDGVPVAGVIGQPFYAREGDGKTLGRVVWGGAGMGVRGLDVADGYEAPPPPPHGEHVVAVNRNIRENRQAPVLEALKSRVDVLISATGYHYLMLLERRAHSALLLRKASKKWDTCAGEALLRATGGIVTDTVGRRYDYTYNLDAVPNLSGMVASSDVGLHCEMTAIIRDVIKPLGEYPYDVVDPSVKRGVLEGLTTPPGGWRAVTVDVGGCLIEPAERVGDVYARIASALGCDHVTSESASTHFKQAFALYRGKDCCDCEALRYYGDGKSFWRKVVNHVLTSALTRKIDASTVERMLDHLYEYYERPSSWYIAHGAVDAIRRLRRSGVRVAVASNWDARLPDLLKSLGVHDEFDALVVSANIEKEKPSTEFFNVLVSELGVDRSTVLHVGDGVQNDYQGAAAAGFGASVLWSSRPVDGVDRRSRDFNEIADAILHANAAHVHQRHYFTH